MSTLSPPKSPAFLFFHKNVLLESLNPIEDLGGRRSSPETAKHLSLIGTTTQNLLGNLLKESGGIGNFEQFWEK